jgi:hypothetical protein
MENAYAPDENSTVAPQRIQEFRAGANFGFRRLIS